MTTTEQVFETQTGCYSVRPYRNEVHDTDEFEIVDGFGTALAYTEPEGRTRAVRFVDLGSQALALFEVAEWTAALTELVRLAKAGHVWVQLHERDDRLAAGPFADYATAEADRDGFDDVYVTAVTRSWFDAANRAARAAAG